MWRKKKGRMTKKGQYEEKKRKGNIKKKERAGNLK